MIDGKRKFVFFSLFNLLFVYGFLFSLGVLSKFNFISNDEVVAVSVFVSSMQLSQAVAHQSVVSNRFISCKYISFIAFFFFVLAATIYFIQTKFKIEELNNIVLPAILGIACTIKFGFYSGVVLVQTGARSFQKILFSRNIVIYPLFFLLSFLKMGIEFLYFSGFLINYFFSKTECHVFSVNNFSQSSAMSEATGSIWVFLLGLFSSLVYRNDINIIRQFVVGSENFFIWHYFLILFSLVSALIGFIITNFFYTKRRACLSFLISLLTNNYIILFLFSLIFSVFLIDNVLILMLLSVVFLCVNSMLSAELHIKALSSIVYSVALISFSLFLFFPSYVFGFSRTDLNAIFLFSGYLGFISFCFLSCSFYLRKKV